MGSTRACATDECFRVALDDMLAYHLPGGMKQWHLEAEFAPKFPLTFFDHHLDSNLALRCVKYLPSISQYLADVAHQAAPKFEAMQFPYLSDDYRAPSASRPKTFRDAQTVFYNYYDSVGRTALKYAAKFHFLPRDPTWSSLFSLARIDWESENETFLVVVSEGFRVIKDSISKLPSTHGLRKYLSDVSLATFNDLYLRYPEVSTWTFFTMSPHAEQLLRKMRAISRLETRLHTTGYALNLGHRERPVDASNGILTELAVLEANQYSLRSKTAKNATRLETRPKSQAVPGKTGPSLTKAATGSNRRRTASEEKNTTAEKPTPVIAPRPKRLGPYTPQHRDFLEHAWNRAVEQDATFIIFHCGCYERIGVRHRASQTLYLSDLIRPVEDTNPTYGTLHLGLHLAIIQDALERESLARTSERQSRSSRKRIRPQGDEDTPSSKPVSKRQKRVAQVPSPAKGLHDPALSSKIDDEIAARDLALFILDYGPYRSSAPSSFLRTAPSCVPCSLDGVFEPPTRQNQYLPNKYISITLSSQAIGHGAIGTVHRATADVQLASGEKLKKTVIVKFASAAEHQEKLEHEHDIYRHLAKARDVEGVVVVHGLFRDIETRILALVMDDAGTNLRKREYERSGEGAKVQTNWEERRAFMKAIRSIHRTRVRHRDIRPDNLTVNKEGQVFFIDFDCAQIDKESRTSMSFDNEVDHMKRVLTGRTDEGDYSRYSDSESMEGDKDP